MKNTLNHSIEPFALRPVKAAKISEISEATAAADVQPEERVNFHIGNPVQDERLSALYFRIVLGLDIHRHDLGPDSLPAVLEELGLATEEMSTLELLSALIKKSAPYMPRGGYLRSNPNELITFFNDWLLKGQPEPLTYDLGRTSGKREVILASGGVLETLRVLFKGLSSYMVHLPARVCTLAADIPDHIKSISNFDWASLPSNEVESVSTLRQIVEEHPYQPTFLILGQITREETRRSLRSLALSNPLFIIEMNNAPNHFSLAREAKMSQRVMRLLTPGIFNPALNDTSLVFMAGNYQFINIFEVTHFQLKGTPSASEVEFLIHVLKQPEMFTVPNSPDQDWKPVMAPKLSSTSSVSTVAAAHAGNIEERLNSIIATTGRRIADRLESSLNRQQHAAANAASYLDHSWLAHDAFGQRGFFELYDALVSNVSNPEWQQELNNSLVISFCDHHPEYDWRCCQVASGSARTALGILGFHCGIREVIIPDFSWTYEHCFPQITTVPLTDNYSLDVDGMIAAVEEKLTDDPSWRTKGAVAINNPHNATGQAFDENDVRRLLRWMLAHDIVVIDDLSYQLVAPSEHLQGPQTIRQLTNGLLDAGYITQRQSALAITVHSLSKTDCLAGSRLAIVEIRDSGLRRRFTEINTTIKPNIASVFLAYTFYRSNHESPQEYWRLRNSIFNERMQALEDAVNNLPDERNPFQISIRRPTGSMYPLMNIEKLPSGLSLDWLSSGLARHGIGLIPLSTFARTGNGYETGRKAFRLTLGGVDSAEKLRSKTRRVLIDLNRMIAEEESSYNKRTFRELKSVSPSSGRMLEISNRWNHLEQQVRASCSVSVQRRLNSFSPLLNTAAYRNEFLNNYLPDRLLTFRRRYFERNELSDELVRRAQETNGAQLLERLHRELYKDSLSARTERFRERSYDRTVHPTQVYSLKTELIWERAIDTCLAGRQISNSEISSLATSLTAEFTGSNVSITSGDESDELLLDIKTLLAAEDFVGTHSDGLYRPFLSYWGDWDGSNRPSGQGHRLVAAVIIENVTRLAQFLTTVIAVESSVAIDPTLLEEIRRLPESNRRFRSLLDTITVLTHQLERRYRGILPYNITPGTLRKIGMQLHIAPDPLKTLWQHNDRLERKMLELRQKRRDTLIYYCSLNKQLRKTLHSLIPTIGKHEGSNSLTMAAATYRDLLQRVIITPRIHQNMILAQDSFAIDTTVHNITEINEIIGSYGNPGMMLGLQISMATEAEALVRLDRKLRARKDEALRNNPNADLPSVWLIPLFEDVAAVQNIVGYLNKVWEYALQSRRAAQSTRDRFAEIACEIFIAGSDLSQQIGQTAGALQYRQAKYQIMTWLAEKDLVRFIRMKMGSGEPMQRQGGYYAPMSGKPAFIPSADTARRLSTYLDESTKKSTEYATTPLMGIFAGGDLRTFQSNLSEQLRYLSLSDLAQALYHVRESQRFHQKELIRAAEPLVETRLQFKTRGLQELERLTQARKDKVFDEFIQSATENFRHILYGREEDVVGIHIISYFIARTTPALRDRPTFRPGRGVAESRGHQIIERIAETIPFSKYGSLLRAIAHNQAQTAMLGVNQLTTGLFRALDSFCERQFVEGEATSLLSDRILPYLPVYEMLHTLRLYHDTDLTYVNRLEKAFPAGNSAFVVLQEDIDAMGRNLVLFQKELLRRHGISVVDFFEGDTIIADVLPTLRPDIAVLLQPDLFNTDPESLLAQIKGPIDTTWSKTVEQLLTIPRQVRDWRSRAWELLEKPVFGRVASFVELAQALYSLSRNGLSKEKPVSILPVKTPAGEMNLKKLFTGIADESMRTFLMASFEYLSGLSQGATEVPTSVVKALKEVERIAKIEELALTPKEQDLLRFYILRIARLCGENG